MEKIKAKGITFTFDDDVSSHYDVVAPTFEKYDLRCTFFINGGNLNLWKTAQEHDGTCYSLSDMTDNQILDLHNRGFDIGNHTYTHLVDGYSAVSDTRDSIFAMENKFLWMGIDVAPVFSYPIYNFNKSKTEILNLLPKLGFKFARVAYWDDLETVGDFELDNNPQTWERDDSHYYTPSKTNPFLVKCCGMFCDNFTFDMFKDTLENAPEDSYCVFNGHVFTLPHQIEKLEKICKFCKENDLNVMRFQDLPL